MNNVSELASISARIAANPTREKRFLAAVGLASDLSLDSTPDGIAEAIEQAGHCLDRQLADDEVWDLGELEIENSASFDLEPLFPNSDLFHLLLEIALIEEEQARAKALNCVVTLMAAQHEHATGLARTFVAAT